MLVSIYALHDPSDISQKIYIGKTKKKLSIRLREHLYPHYLKKKTEKNSWIKSLLTRSISPEIILFEKVPIETWKSDETFWIESLKSIGLRLVNGTSGGDGVYDPTDEVRQRMRKSHLGKIPWNKGLTKSEDSRLSGNTKPVSKETRDNMRKAHLGKELTDEHKENIRKAITGSGNHFFGKNHTEAAKEKNRQAHLGKKLDDVAKEKCRVAAKKYWEKKREKNS